MVDAFSPHSPSSTCGISLPLRLDSRLKVAALNSDDFSLDCLFTLALEQGNPDSEAAAIFLFDIYIGNKNACNEPVSAAAQPCQKLRAQLAAKASELCMLVSAMASKGDLIAVPASILLMAGFESQEGSEQREKVLDQLRANKRCCEKMAQIGQPLNSTLFATNRYICGEELNAIAAQLNQPDSAITFHHASSVLYEHDHLVMQFAQNRPHIDVVPLLAGDHWLLWVMLTRNDGERISLFFDSLAKLSREAKSDLNGLAKACNMVNPVWVEGNLQDNAPNACGVFMMKAMQAIANAPHHVQPALEKIISDFLNLDEQEQTFGIRHGRAELLGAFIAHHSQVEQETSC